MKQPKNKMNSNQILFLIAFYQAYDIIILCSHSTYLLMDAKSNFTYKPPFLIPKAVFHLKPLKKYGKLRLQIFQKYGRAKVP